MKTIAIQIWGGFHAQMSPISLRVPAKNYPDLPTMGAGAFLSPGILSEGQIKKLHRHMCGIKGCLCGPHHGWQ